MKNKFKLNKNALSFGKSWGWAFFFFLSISSLQAQDWQWIKSGGSTDNINPWNSIGEMTEHIVTDSQRNIYAIAPVGYAGLNIDGNAKQNWDNYGGGVEDYALFSFACDGTYRWSKIIGGEGPEDIKGLAIDSLDNIYIW